MNVELSGKDAFAEFLLPIFWLFFAELFGTGISEVLYFGSIFAEFGEDPKFKQIRYITFGKGIPCHNVSGLFLRELGLKSHVTLKN